MHSRCKFGALLGLVLAAVPVMYAPTLTSTWTGATTQIVNDGTNTNWLEGTAPVSGTDVNLIFGVPANPGLSQSSQLRLLAGTTFDVAELTFNSNFPKYSFSSSSIEIGATLKIGGYGIQSTGTGDLSFGTNLTLQLNGNQTWTTASTLWVKGAITGSSNLTKNGTGQLVLGSSSPAFTGNLTVAQGMLSLFSGNSAGTGNLILQGSSTLDPYDSPISIPNDVKVSNDVSFDSASGGAPPFTPDITVTGNFTVMDNSVLLHLIDNTNLRLNGTLDASASGTSLAFDSGGTVILAGNTGSNILKITADGANVTFASPNSIPAVGSSIQALNNGYIGIGATSLVAANVPSPTTVLARITDKANFNGTLGFDTAPTLGSTYTYTDPLSLLGFSTTTFKIGSATNAVLGPAAVITPPTGGDYRFGDGGGRLIVQSNLTTLGNNVIVNSVSQHPLALVLQGNNTFNGDLTSIRSYVVLDSTGALPSTSKIHLGASGYVGATPNWGSLTTPAADLIGRVSVPDVSSTGMIGFDSVMPVTSYRVINDTIDLRGFATASALPYISTTTFGIADPTDPFNSLKYDATKAGLTLNGTFLVPAGKTLGLAGVNGGFLRIASNLTAANGVTSVVIGHPNADFNKGQEGVALNGTNDYTGGTTLLNGSLFLGNNSALGTGALTIANSANNGAIVPTVALTLANSVVANNGIMKVDASSFPITFNGAISGSARLGLGGTVTLGTANSYTGGTDLGDSAHVTVNSNTGFGPGNVDFGNSVIVTFTTTAPSIGSLDGGCSASGIVLPTNATSLTINQTNDGTFGGNISGPSSGATTAALFKNGSAELVLAGTNSYSGGTIINGGKLVAGSNGALGTGAVTINGGSLGLKDNAVIPNSITFGAGGGTLGGTGTIGSNITVASNIKLAPGNSPGTLTFTGALTWATGGSYNFEIVSAAGNVPGASYDTIVIASTGSLTITANSGGKFNLNLLSLSGTSTAGNVADFNPYTGYSWQIVSSTNAIGGFTAGAFNIDTTGFTNSLNGGLFNVSLGGPGGNTALFLNFTPVPEPSTWALIIVGAGAVLFPALRRRRS